MVMFDQAIVLCICIQNRWNSLFIFLFLLWISRAAKEITIAVSKDEAQWDPAITVELIDTLSSSPTCNIPLEKFPLPFVYGRYMKFTIDSYYGDLHGGIGYMVVEYFQ